MVIQTNLVFAVLLQFASLFLVQAQDQPGFISIDCGSSKLSYTDKQTGITYLSDSDFIESGENSDVLASYKSQIDNEQQFWNVRSFPEGTKNCYTLKPLGGKGTRYLIRARFMYGNYDNKLKFPRFNLFLGIDLWQTIEIGSSLDIISQEIVHVLSSDSIHVCLVNIGLGVPFISVLELRPLQSDIYESETGSLLLEYRYDFGSVSTKLMRYKDDVYDRLWSPYKSNVWIAINTSLREDNIFKNSYEIPFAVISTAYTKPQGISYMGFIWNLLNITCKYFMYVHTAELENLQTNQTREFKIYVNDGVWFERLVPKYQTSTIHSTEGTEPDKNGNIVMWFNNTANATVPPLVNAIEIYRLQENSGQETYQTDADAILNIKLEYKLSIQSWQGDPCGPKPYLWDGLSCTSSNNLPPRITSLNLSSSGLKGEISPYIANLKSLRYLDLSSNSLTGTLPEFLADLPFLKVLNLKENNLEGPVPEALSKRTNNGLSLSVDDNVMGKNETPLPPSNRASSLHGSSHLKEKLVVPAVASLCGFLVNYVL